GFRMTKQRRVVYDVLLGKLDHPTASDVFDRAKGEMSTISLATVYNCLETLTDVGLVKQVNIDREPSRYCPNLHDHAHFFCKECGAVQDVAPRQDDGALETWDLPAGHRVDRIEVAMRGLCQSCASQLESDEPAGANGK
ncbi:MAG: transcriptional repressor, partial [Verrucomicrobiota bacterium]